MRPDKACPDTEELRRLMLGQVSNIEAEPLERHLAECPPCSARVEQLEAEDQLIAAMRCRSPILQDPEMPAVEELIDRLRGLRRAPPSTPERAVDALALLELPQGPEEIGRVGPYRVLRVLGAGGMGVVYQARDTRLKRVVAVKMALPTSRASQERIDRFRREAEVVARLRHPHIVQVYEVGEHAGRVWFAMEYLEGGNLGQQLATCPLSPEPAAELVETLARAIHAAHQAGVVHRDLKPANVLLAADGSPKITDFGLAKQVDDPTSLPAGYATQSGALLGTPSYMAPEQAGHGQEVGPSSDVYALGAILYECLTGRPPFHAARPLETLDQVRTQEPVPPGRLQPGLPRDLQTICLKCLEKEPGRRYGSAADLADDLHRWLDGEPIRARPAGVAERLLKWARRRPSLCALIVVSLVALAALVSSGVIYEWRLRQALHTAEANRERADANYRQARETMRRILSRSDARQAAGLPQLRELRREQQEDALAFFLTIAEQTEPTPEVRHDVAFALREAGKIQMDLGRRDEARNNLERSLELSTVLAAKLPLEPRHRWLQAMCWNDLGFWHAAVDEKLRCYNQALALREALIQEDPTNAEYRSALADSQNNVGTVYFRRREWEKAEPYFRKAVRHREELVGKQPSTRAHRLSLAEVQLNLSVLYQNSARPEAMQEFHDRAEEALRALVAEDPHDIDSVCNLAMLRINWAHVLAGRGKAEATLPELAESARALDGVLRREPNHEVARDRLRRTHGIRAQLLEKEKRYTEAVVEWERVVELDQNRDQRDFDQLFLVMARARAGQHARAVKEAEALVRPTSLAAPEQHFLHLAQVCCVAAAAALEDKELSVQERDEHALRYAGKAVEMLGKARDAAGPEKWREMRKTLPGAEEFRPLRGREDFQRLLQSAPG